MITVEREVLQTKEFNGFVENKGLQVGDKVKGMDFIFWIQDKHKEFRKIKGIGDRRPYTQEEYEEFYKFIRR
ncbi:MAG: hypothetical protein SCJ93_14410 [Bacillota bacterium]|jgi:hypothetical protein|nr:hypothetical protein [Bacillota bacterium]